MKYEASFKILEAIGSGIIESFDLFEAFSGSGYGASSRKIERNLSKIRERRAEKKLKKEEERKRTNRYHSLIYKLKRDGLIKEEEGKEGKKYALTVAGEQKLELLKGKEGFPDVYYAKEKGSRVIIVMFDIPEVWTKKRTWLLMVLENLDYKMAQKSVWIGKTKIPKELIKDLMRMQLEDFIEIFEVGNTGNLKNII